MGLGLGQESELSRSLLRPTPQRPRKKRAKEVTRTAPNSTLASGGYPVHLFIISKSSPDSEVDI